MQRAGAVKPRVAVSVTAAVRLLSVCSPIFVQLEFGRHSTILKSPNVWHGLPSPLHGLGRNCDQGKGYICHKTRQ